MCSRSSTSSSELWVAMCTVLSFPGKMPYRDKLGADSKTLCNPRLKINPMFCFPFWFVQGGEIYSIVISSMNK